MFTLVSIHEGRRLNLNSISIEILLADGGWEWVNYYGRALFCVLNATKTTIIDEYNSSYNDVIDVEGDDDDGEEMPQARDVFDGT